MVTTKKALLYAKQERLSQSTIKMDKGYYLKKGDKVILDASRNPQ